MLADGCEQELRTVFGPAPMMIASPDGGIILDGGVSQGTVELLGFKEALECCKIRCSNGDRY